MTEREIEEYEREMFEARKEARERRARCLALFAANLLVYGFIAGTTGDLRPHSLIEWHPYLLGFLFAVNLGIYGLANSGLIE